MAYVARLDAAESAVRRHDYRAAVHLLHRAPSLVQGTGDGRVYELMALCAMRSQGVAAGDPWALWHRCLAAYQEAHDARGMQRAHRAIGLWAYGRGELGTAAQQLQQAQRLLEREHRVDATVLGLCSQAVVAMAQGRQSIDQGYTWANEAVALSQHHEELGHLEAQARLVRARATCLLGAISEAALDMLWAERLASPVASSPGQDGLRLGLCRAESLLLLGHPRRAATCLQALSPVAQASLEADARAHFQLMRCQALVNDQPHDAHASGLLCLHYYVAHKQTYMRAASEIALVRTAVRLGHADAQDRLRAVTALRLEPRWPLLTFAHRRAQEEVEAPHHHALGAVKTPWMRAVGKIDLSAATGHEHQPAVQEIRPGFVDRLHHAIGKVIGENNHHAAAQTKNS